MIKLFLRLSLFTFLALFFIQCQTDSGKIELTLTNNSSVDLTDKAISVERSQLGEIPEGKVFPLIVSLNGDTIPAQLDDLDGDKTWDELFFVADLPANGKGHFTLEWSYKMPDFPVRTSVRFGKRMSAEIPVKPANEEVLTAKQIPWTLGFQRYQTDGPTWENDKVGFRHYLDGRNAKDLFGKKTSAISPEDVGLDENGATVDNYHVMEDWGRDILSVGNSVGIGGYGLLVGDKLLRLGIIAGDTVSNVEKTSFRIVTEGPVRSALNYQYSNWSQGNREYFVEENTTIWPGMYAYQNFVKISGLKGDEELVVGLVNINTESDLTEIEGNDKYVVLFTHDKQTYEKEWWLGMALIVPRDSYLGFMEAPKTGQLSNTFLARFKIENDKPLSYFAVGCWELSDEGFADKEYFEGYLKNLADQLEVDVEISIN
jgi:hypothetical protein